jgi:predicted enzyme related to lactoylglutathione lyase
MTSQRASEAAGRLRGVVVDADDLELLAAFWGAVLGVGIAEQFEDWVMLDPAGGAYLAFQPRDLDAERGARLRLDIEVADVEVATTRIETLGGRLVDIDDETSRLMADPEGNEFSIVLPSTGSTGGSTGS